MSYNGFSKLIEKTMTPERIKQQEDNINKFNQMFGEICNNFHFYKD
jgi:hypothetical protein